MRTWTVAFVLVGVVALGLPALAQTAERRGRSAGAAVLAFETSQQARTGRWVDMHRHSFLGIPFGKIKTAHEAMARLRQGKRVVLTPMQLMRSYVGRMMEPLPMEGKARPSAVVRSMSELSTWARDVGLPFLSFSPEKVVKPTRPSLPAIKVPPMIRGLDSEIPAAEKTAPKGERPAISLIRFM